MTGRDLPTVGCLALVWLVSAVSMGCGDREFPTEREAIAHFRGQRPKFQEVARLFLDSNAMSLEVPSVRKSGVEPELPRLCRDLRVSDIARVPQVKTKEEQWVELRLAQRLLRSSYGLLYVPEGHNRALNLITFLARSPTHGIHVVRPIEGRWFYFEYD